MEQVKSAIRLGLWKEAIQLIDQLDDQSDVELSHVQSSLLEVLEFIGYEKMFPWIDGA